VGSAGRPRARIADVTGAFVAALLAFTAVPAVLVLIVGNPLAGGLGHAWQTAPRDALVALALAAWVAWAACASQLARGVVVHVRRGEIGPLVGVGSPLDRVAARIAIGVLALTSAGAGASVVLASGAGAATPASTSVVVAAAAPVNHDDDHERSSAVVHTVRPGESLWQIADDRLGDGADWMQVAALNLGHDMGGGQRFVDPDQVRAGWRLRLPAEARHHDAGRSTGRSPDRLPELVALGVGSLACAALARRSRSRRRPVPFSGDFDLPRRSEPAVDADTLLQRFADVPALAAFEAANRLLGRVLQDHDAPPRLRTICVAPSGVTFCLAGAPDNAPEPFVALEGGAAWRVSHAALDDADLEPSFPHAPLVVPIGDDDEGTWLVPLAPGDVLPVLGESAPSLVRAARAALESWEWSDLIVVTDDPGHPGLRPRAAAEAALFVGDPSSLPPDVARRTAVVTTAPVAASDLTVLVDRQAATLHPVGRVLRPHLPSPDTEQLLAELVTPPTGVEVVEARRPPPAVTTGTPVIAPGPVDVRLLTATPRLDGLVEDLPPNRARRSVELVAYLALHQPDVITSDRLRTRVLGSSDADAAAKTLSNTAHAARRAMGADESGQPLFPAGTRNGLFQLAPCVTVDVHRATALATEAKAQTDPQLAMAHYSAALELVDGEPLANALSGYSWWEAEGHGARIAAVLVDAACGLAVLAAEAHLFDLGRRGLERARLVEPYSEALSRAAMELAAAEGDADRLRLEWRECQRRVDALDPGSTPSPRTETLYGELSRRVLVSGPTAF
jgi:DNA-binding SARP family transcriptional activator